MAQNKSGKGAAVGRPSKYIELVQPKLKLVEAWARDGLTDEQIATKLGIGYSTLSLYKTQHIELVEALKRGKEVVDVEVENALFKRAIGYKYTETTREKVLSPTTKEYELCVTKEVVKEVAPDVTAQIFWLKNRKPAEWRDKTEVDTSVTVTEADRNLLAKVSARLDKNTPRK